MAVTQEFDYEELERTVSEYVDADYSMALEEAGGTEVLLLESEEDIFDQLIVLGNELGSQVVSKREDSNEYRVSLENLF